MLNADLIGVLHQLLLPPPFLLPPLLAWHTNTIFVCSAQNSPLVSLGHDLPPTPNRPLIGDRLGTLATRRPQLGPLNGLGDMQVQEPKVRALG